MKQYEDPAILIGNYQEVSFDEVEVIEKKKLKPNKLAGKT